MVPIDVPTIESSVPPTRVPAAPPTEPPGVGPNPEPTERSTESPPSQPTEAPATESAPQPTAIPTVGPTEPDDDETVIRQISFSVSLPGVDLPDAAQLCLESADFAACAPLVPVSVASVYPALLIQATGIYTASFTDLPEGTYSLTIPSIGSFPGYRTTITIDREMSSVITIDMSEDQSAPDVPTITDQPTPPNEPRDQGPRFATPIVADPPLSENPDPGGSSGPLPSGDGTSGSANGGRERSRLVEDPAHVTMLPSTGTGASPVSGPVLVGTLLTVSLLILHWAVQTWHRERR